MNDWLEVIDEIKYLREYDVYEYEDEERPSEESVFNAFKLILKIEDGPPPLRVVPCGDNGLAFEWRSGDIFEEINVTENEIDHLIFNDCTIIDRYKIKIN
jgi:hypothetical protein